VRFEFATPVDVLPGTQYGFDVTSNSGAFYFETLGIRDAATGGNPYSGGSAYNGSTNGVADNTMNPLAGDRVFEVEFGAAGVSTPPYAAPVLQAEPFPLDRVRLLDSRFKSNQDLHRTGYLAWLDPDRLLYQFRVIAGLPQVNGATHLGGWEGGSGFTAVRGHMAGHYLSAASKMYASTGDASYLAKIQYLVAELKKCQDAIGVQEVAAGRIYGYLSGFPISYFSTLETNPTSAQVPFYTIHKIMAGLVDAYRYGGVNQALDIAISMSDYHQWRVNRLTSAQIEAMFRTDNGNTEEWGGMNETLTDIYLLSRARGDATPERHLSFAQVFHRDWFINPLYNNLDQLNGLHANTHIPQVVGFAHTASVLNTADTQRTRLYTAADNFWHIVLNSHSLALGGNSYGEFFSTAGKETGTGGSALTVSTAETCNSYNMLKLTKELFEHNPGVQYADYYEHALYNHILASLAPDTGMPTYFVPMISGHFKTYSQPEGSCWCCTGTGIENTPGYNQAIYFHKDDVLWVNLFIPSTLNWSEQGMTVRLETTFPRSGTVKLTMGCTTPTSTKIRVRIPSWVVSTPAVAVNGVMQGVAPVAGSYLELSRTWSDGDVVNLTLPMGLRIDRSMDDSSQVSLFYGPVLLAGDLGTSGMPASDQAPGQWDYQNVARAAAPSMIAPTTTDLGTWVKPGTDPLTFTIDAGIPGDEHRRPIVLKPFFDVHHTRYAVYWNLIDPAGASSWSGGGTQTDWSNGNNWDTVPSAGYALHFGTPGGGNPNNNLTAGTQFGGLEFAAGGGGFTTGGNAIGLRGDVRNFSAFSQRINMPLELKDSLPWQFDAAGGDLVIGASVGGVGSVNKRGSHSLILLGDSTFAGSASVDEGILQIGNGGSTGSLGNVPTSVAAGSELIFNRGDNTEIASSISGAGQLVKRGAGTITLTTPSGLTGSVRVEEGKLQFGTRTVQALIHRWSFNGNLLDSAGGATSDTTLSSNSITLSGGTKTAADYVSLGSGLLPKDSSPVTLEFWATQRSLQAWSRIFDTGASTAENLFMSWSQATLNTDRVEWRDSGTTGTVNNTAAPYTLGTEYHIVLMIEPGAGNNSATRVSWYAAPASAGSLGSAKGSFETTLTPAMLDDASFCLGRSQYNDPTANAEYNEVRMWNRAFSASELAELHAYGPNSVGAYASLPVTGSLAAVTGLSLGAGAEFNPGTQTQETGSLSGEAGSLVRFSGGQMRIMTGGNAAAVFAGSFAGTGTVENLGVLRLVGNAVLPAGITLVNYGVLDVMTWQGELPAGFVNHGTVLDRGKIKVDGVERTGNDFKVQIQGYNGHGYRLQWSEDLTTGIWHDTGETVPGSDASIQFVHSAGASSSARFYRVAVSP
jgi:autotransporter-associated beta strand protein